MISIYCCCGSGLGSSLILQMSTEEALANLGISVYELRFGQASSIPFNTDFVLCSDELAPNLSCEQPIYGIHDMMDEQEVAQAIQKYIKEHSYAMVK